MARSSSRSNRAETNWRPDSWSSGPSGARSSSRSNRDDDAWWKQDWWQCSDWQAHTEDSNKDWQPGESPAEQPEQRAEAPRQEENASPPPIAPQSSAGSTSTVPIARQDKRAADVMESGEPTKRSNRPPPQKPVFLTFAVSQNLPY